MIQSYPFGCVSFVVGLICLVQCSVTLSDEKVPQDDRAVEAQVRHALNQRVIGAVEKALASQTQLEFIETPLADVIEYLEDTHHIQIVLDSRTLDVVGIGSDTPITRNLKGISLRSALRLMLRDLELTYMIQDEVLMITTPEEAQESSYIRIYDIRDLATDEKSAKELLTTLQTVPDKKNEVCHMTIFRSRLVVRASQRQHEQLNSLLYMLRADLPDKEEPPTPSHPFSRWKLGPDVDLSGTRLYDDDLIHLKNQTHIVTLDLSGTRIRDQGVAHLTTLADLKELRLNNTRITDDAIVHLKALKKLENLDLSDTKITNAGLEQLAELKQLRSLTVGIENGRKSDITKGTVEKLKTSLRGCKITARYQPSKPMHVPRPAADPFGTPAPADPFGGGGAKDPFGGGADPFEGGVDPFKD